ncbi:prephenate dehydrogenase [Candidatus Omnitrophota bacterium]
MFNKIAIIGVGLIGGSMGLAAKRKKLAKEIVGVCRHRASLHQAKKIKAIDRGTLDYKDAVQNAELVVLAAPVQEIIRLSRKIGPYLAPDCIVTDVGSTKQKIVDQLDQALPMHCNFVGGHPLAGSEKRSVSFARADLFKDAVCFLTRTKKTNLAALSKLSKFWRGLGSRVKIISPQRHDQIVATVSHLPHLIAVELVNLVDKNIEFVASGFRDTTRIAASEAEIWTDIFLTNDRHILGVLDTYIKRLKLFRGLIAEQDKSKLNYEFKKAKSLRDALQE